MRQKYRIASEQQKDGSIIPEKSLQTCKSPISNSKNRPKPSKIRPNSPEIHPNFIQNSLKNSPKINPQFVLFWPMHSAFFGLDSMNTLDLYIDSNLNPPITLNSVFDILLHAAGIVLLMISSLQSLLSPLTRTWSRSICSLLVLILSSVLYRYLRSWWWRHNDDAVVMMTSRSHEETSNFTFLSHLR